MKQRLEEIWNDRDVRCPHHQVWWHDGVHAKPDGPASIVSNRDHPEAPGLFWSKGKKYAPPARKKLEWP